MNDSPSEAAPDTAADEAAVDVAADEAAAEEAVDTAAVAALVGADSWSEDFGNPKVRVPRERWTEALATARDAAGLDFFSWLSAIDWARDVAVGDPVEAPDDLQERFEVLCRLSTVTDGRGVTFSTDVPKDDPVLDSIVTLFGGAGWHEREAYEMFGIEFRGNPRLIKLYLPDAFEGNPLRKSYPLLSREVKPWPGLVDVEGMPSEDSEDGNGGDEGETE